MLGFVFGYLAFSPKAEDVTCVKPPLPQVKHFLADNVNLEWLTFNHELVKSDMRLATAAILSYTLLVMLFAIAALTGRLGAIGINALELFHSSGDHRSTLSLTPNVPTNYAPRSKP